MVAHCPRPGKEGLSRIGQGGLFGKGLESSPDRLSEPVFGLDVDYPADRSIWRDEDFFSIQPFAGIGVRCDDAFRPFRGGRVVENLYVAGSEVGGCNSLYEGSGAGVAILTAMSVAERILSGQ